MDVINESSKSFVMLEDRSVISNQEISDTALLPSGDSVNNSCILKSSGNENLDTEPRERKKKTRRGKSKRKNPYNKEVIENRKGVMLPKNLPRLCLRYAEAPNNTNEFLMEDHNSFVELNSPQITQTNPMNSRPQRVRDPSFTSVESDEERFYSSPEDEEDFLTREFSNTYRDLHVETLQAMTKSDLIQQVLQLEDKIDTYEKQFGNMSKSDEDQYEEFKNEEENFAEDCDKVTISLEKIKQFQLEISKLHLENEKLQIENERLQRHTRALSVSSIDSESDSSCSSQSIGSDLSDKELLEPTENYEGKDAKTNLGFVCDESNINDDVFMEEKNPKEQC